MSRSQVRRQTGALAFGSEDADCTILHVDMDAFYAMVELRSRPELKGKPVIIGSTGGRGVVLSATYEARALGVHSAMPMSRARRIAPDAVIIPPRHGVYGEVSANIMALFESITPLVEPISLDEAFLDVSGAVRRLGSPIAIAELIRSRVADEQGITCSVGVAATKFVAKLGSTRCKPDGLLLIPRESTITFLHPLPANALWGVGERTEEQLARLGLRTVGDIANTPVATLQRAVGQAAGAHLHELSWGRDSRRVTPGEPEKSIGNEETFAVDIDDQDEIRGHLLRLSDHVAARLRKADSVGRTVVLKVRFADFSTITRSRTLPSPTDVGGDVYSTARALFDGLGLQRARVRLVGVRIEGLSPASGAAQQMLLGERELGRREAEVAVDSLRARFGRDSVQAARLVDRPTDQQD